MGIQGPQINVQVTPAIVDIQQTPSQLQIDGSVGKAGIPVQPTPEADPASQPNGQLLEGGDVRIQGTQGSVDVNVIQKPEVNFQVTGVRVDFINA